MPPGLLLLLLVRPGRLDIPRQMTIAAIFDQEGGGEEQKRESLKHELAFRHAVQNINWNR